MRGLLNNRLFLYIVADKCPIIPLCFSEFSFNKNRETRLTYLSPEFYKILDCCFEKASENILVKLFSR